MSEDNIWADAWEPGEDWSGGGGQARRLPRGEQLGATLYELGPGNFAVYHFHHAQEELLIVLRGRPTLRTPEVAEYPDLKQITAFAGTGSQTGQRLWLIHDVEPARPDES